MKKVEVGRCVLKWLRVGLERKQEGCWFVVGKSWEGLEKRVGGVKGVQVGWERFGEKKWKGGV